MSFDKIQQLVGSLAQKIEDNEKIATPVLVTKLAKCLQSYPEDQTIGAMARVVEKMADNNTLFIRKAELKSLYHKLYSRNTKFAQLFSEELGLSDNLPTPTLHKRDDAGHIDVYAGADAVLSNALNSVFDKNTPLKMYSQALADKAKKSVASVLDACNLKPSNITVDDGNEKFLVVKADYDTPKGVTSFYVPVEVLNNKVAEAAVFMGNVGPQELNNNNVKNYLHKNAGSKLKITGSNILDVLTKAASENREVSDAELALTRLNASRQTQSDFFQGQVVGLKVAEAAPKDIEFKKSNEFKSFEDHFTSPYGQASFNFGEDKVKIARDNISRELLSLGHKNPQVAVVSSDKSTIFYGVSLDSGKVAFTVPVKIANNKIQKPTTLICNGSIASFDNDSINKLYINNQTDYKAAAAASPLFGLKPSDLIDNIRKAAQEGNLAQAEDALNVLAGSGDTKAYATGFHVYASSLNKPAENDITKHPLYSANDFYTTAHSKMPISKQTGLPINKIYIDEYGNHRPLYRRGMSETYEGASFMNAKIFG